VEVIDRSARKEQSKHRTPVFAQFLKKIFSYSALLLIPVVIFKLLLMVAHLK
jgi:hypothetical protein